MLELEDLPSEQRKLLWDIAEHYALHESIQGEEEQAAITASGDYEQLDSILDAVRYHETIVSDEKAYQKLSDVFKGVTPFRPRPNLYLQTENACLPGEDAEERARD